MPTGTDFIERVVAEMGLLDSATALATRTRLVLGVSEGPGRNRMREAPALRRLERRK